MTNKKKMESRDARRGRRHLERARVLLQGFGNETGFGTETNNPDMYKIRSDTELIKYYKGLNDTFMFEPALQSFENYIKANTKGCSYMTVFAWILETFVRGRDSLKADMNIPRTRPELQDYFLSLAREYNLTANAPELFSEYLDSLYLENSNLAHSYMTAHRWVLTNVAARTHEDLKRQLDKMMSAKSLPQSLRHKYAEHLKDPRALRDGNNTFLGLLTWVKHNEVAAVPQHKAHKPKKWPWN